MDLFCLPFYPLWFVQLRNHGTKYITMVKTASWMKEAWDAHVKEKSSCLSLPALANNGSGTSTFIWGVRHSPSIWCQERGMSHSPCLPRGQGLAFCQDCHAMLLCMLGPVWLNASWAEITTGEEFVTSAAREMTPGSCTGSSTSCRALGRRMLAQVQQGRQTSLKRP